MMISTQQERKLHEANLTTAHALSFTGDQILTSLDAAGDVELDALDFGVIGFDAGTLVRRYNLFESKAAGLPLARVVGNALFTAVAPCMNNFMVAQRFEDAIAQGTTLDATIDYVLTLRMRPVKVKLRLLADPGHAMCYVLVQRQG